MRRQGTVAHYASLPLPHKCSHLIRCSQFGCGMQKLLLFKQITYIYTNTKVKHMFEPHQMPTICLRNVETFTSLAATSQLHIFATPWSKSSDKLDIGRDWAGECLFSLDFVEKWPQKNGWQVVSSQKMAEKWSKISLKAGPRPMFVPLWKQD